jgi:ABC-type dipeptide/oligopeptide/nickel transport system permease subunit
VYLALGMISWISTCRLVRAETMKIKELDFVVAARASGRGDMAILVRHIVPNVFHIAIINFSLGFVSAISAEVMLSFLNLGVQDLPSWGKMINDARMDLVVGRWWELTAAVGATFIIVLSWNIFGDRLRDALDPKLR